MDKTTLISLVSDQTLPNVELIKEFKERIDKYLFVHSTKTQTNVEWIVRACELDTNQVTRLLVNPFDWQDIEEKLKNYEFEDENYILNITGGTKLMILVFQEFFKNLGASIYYVTGQNLTYVKTFPALGQRTFQFTKKINLHEYLYSYGFEIKPGTPSNTYIEAKSILNFFLHRLSDDSVKAINILRNHRSKPFKIAQSPEVAGFIEMLNYQPINPNKLTKYDNKYLSGDWFEEYVYYSIKQELNLADDEIGTGYNLFKKNTPNEIDVIFIYNNKLHIIECKTSVFDERILPSGGIKRINLLPEIIYKCDALRGKFGLFAYSAILTLEELKTSDGIPLENFSVHFERADGSQIKIISRNDIIGKSTFKELLNIK
jgi:hypothetical protein